MRLREGRTVLMSEESDVRLKNLITRWNCNGTRRTNESDAPANQRKAHKAAEKSAPRSGAAHLAPPRAAHAARAVSNVPTQAPVLKKAAQAPRRR
jgi:hypothetical protein